MVEYPDVGVYTRLVREPSEFWGCKTSLDLLEIQPEDLSLPWKVKVTGWDGEGDIEEFVSDELFDNPLEVEGPYDIKLRAVDWEIDSVSGDEITVTVYGADVA